MYCKEEHYDVAIIGAGPAGALAGALAAQAGFSTVILEHKKMPRLKPCGGLISARALSTLPPDFDLRQIESEAVTKIFIYRGKRKYNACFEQSPGLLVKRASFDQRLAGYAAEKGALIKEEYTLKKLEEIGYPDSSPSYYRLTAAESKTAPVTARYVIGADGALGRLGSLAGLRGSKPGLCGWALTEFIETVENVSVPGTIAFYPLPFLGGMAWTFRGLNWINRGMGGLCRPKFLRKAYGQLFPGVITGSALSCWPLPFTGPLKKAGQGNILLVGDAAGLVEPFSGEGLCNAFKSAIFSICALKEADQKKTAAGEVYSRLYKAHFRKTFPYRLVGAVLLHGQALIHPASIPRRLAYIMNNRQS